MAQQEDVLNIGGSARAADAARAKAKAEAGQAPKARKPAAKFGAKNKAALKDRKVFEVLCPELGENGTLFHLREPSIHELGETIARFGKVAKDLQSIDDLDAEKPQEAINIMGELAAGLIIDPDDNATFLTAAEGADLFFMDGALPLRQELMRLMTKVESGWRVPVDKKGRPVFQAPAAGNGDSASGSPSPSALPTPTG